MSMLKEERVEILGALDCLLESSYTELYGMHIDDCHLFIAYVAFSSFMPF